MAQRITCYDIEDVRKLTHRYWQFDDGRSLRKDLKSENYIWDEDLTVRKNKELTHQYNDAINAKIKEYQEAKVAYYEQMNKAITEFIVEETKYNNIMLTEAQAQIVWQRVWHDHEDEPWVYLSQYIDFAIAILEVK